MLATISNRLKLVRNLALIAVVIATLILCGLVGFLLLDAELLAREHIPKIQQAVGEQCSENVEVKRESIHIDDGITWKDHSANGREWLAC